MYKDLFWHFDLICSPIKITKAASESKFLDMIKAILRVNQVEKQRSG